MPLTEIITAANTVSRARPEVSLSPLTMSVTIRATSMTVTATARISEPKGSPTRWATTSAWCTAAEHRADQEDADDHHDEPGHRAPRAGAVPT